MIKESGAAVMQPSDDTWNKIVMFNVDQYQRDLEESKQKVRNNQIRMKEELEKQVLDHKRAKEEEKRKELDFIQGMKQHAEELQRREKEKQENIKKRMQQENLLRDKLVIENKNKR